MNDNPIFFCFRWVMTVERKICQSLYSSKLTNCLFFCDNLGSSVLYFRGAMIFFRNLSNIDEILVKYF